MFNEFVYEMRWARSTTPNRSQKEKKRVWSSRQWPRLRRREHESRINTDHDISKAATVAITLLTANHRLRVCVCVWLCVVSSRPCKTGEPNKNNAECMQYIRCEHKIHLNIYMKSIWDHIFFFILTKCILQWWVTTVDSYSERREPSQKDTGLIGVRCQFIDKSILICNAFEVGCCWSNALFRSHHLRLESYVTWL